MARRQTESHPNNIYKDLKAIRQSFAKRANGSLIEKPVQVYVGICGYMSNLNLCIAANIELICRPTIPISHQAFVDIKEATDWLNLKIRREEHLVKHGYIQREVPAPVAAIEASAAATTSSTSAAAAAAPASDQTATAEATDASLEKT